MEITKTLNTKINGVVHAMQIDDIAGQIIDESINRINLNYVTIENIQNHIKEISSLEHDDKFAALQIIKQEIDIALSRKKRNHVIQKDLDEGSTELF